MVIDFVFEKGISPWNEIEIKREESIKKVVLIKTSERTRRIELTGEDHRGVLLKRNVWHDGIEEVFFSMDGNFNNTFNADRLPYSIEIPIAGNEQSKIIRVPADVVLMTDDKSQNRWKIATFIQSFLAMLILVFCSTVLAIVFCEIWELIISLCVIFSVLIAVFIVKRTRRFISIINNFNKN